VNSTGCWGGVMFGLEKQGFDALNAQRNVSRYRE
jgi:hypothetical protein